MEKATETNEKKINWGKVGDWVVALLVPSIPLIIAKVFDGKDNDIITKVFFTSLITSSVITFIWIRFISDKRNEKLFIRLIKEIEVKNNLEKEKTKLEQSLAWKQTFLSDAKKDGDKLSEKNKKLENERDQLIFALRRCGVKQEEIEINENISIFDWEGNPEIQKKVEEATNKTYNELRDAERDVFSLSLQLEKECRISKDKQNVGDKRLRKWAIEDVEGTWISRSDKNKKIRGKILEGFLGIYWKSNFENKEGEEIIEEAGNLNEKIQNFADGK